jgi:hypothetical protein
VSDPEQSVNVFRSFVCLFGLFVYLCLVGCSCFFFSVAM